MHSTESRFVTGPSNILFAGVYVCTFQPRNFTSWGRVGVNLCLLLLGGRGGGEGAGGEEAAWVICDSADMRQKRSEHSLPNSK